MSKTDRPSEPKPSGNGSFDPNAPALDDNAKAGFGEKGAPVPEDEHAGSSESEKLDDAVADLDNG